MKAKIRINFFKNGIVCHEVNRYVEVAHADDIAIVARNTAERTMDKYNYDSYAIMV